MTIKLPATTGSFHALGSKVALPGSLRLFQERDVAKRLSGPKGRRIWELANHFH
jgi:hypothetical protein